MSKGPQFIIKDKKSGRELLAVATEHSLQPLDRLELVLLEHKDYVPGRSFLFMRVSNDANEQSLRFREGRWYRALAFDHTNNTITVKEYKEHFDIWEVIEKRINPVAVILASLISSIVTLVGTRMVSVDQDRFYESEVTSLRNEVAQLKAIVETVKMQTLQEENRGATKNISE